MSKNLLYIRSACAEDQSDIKSIVRQARINPFGLDWRRFVVVENHHGKVVGVGQIKPHHDGTLELASLALLPDCRGQGVGRVIVQALLARERRTIYLMCAQKMQVYYVFFGFRRISQPAMPHYFRVVSSLFNMLMLLFGSRERVIVMKRDSVSLQD
jgi:N-acetylglutamate synthase-like GNAT family acetyltransferase